MTYKTEVALTGAPDRALAVVRDALLANGFELLNERSGRLEFEGPGVRRSRQNGLCGISRATIGVTASDLSAEAELGGAASLGRFVIVFPFAVALLLVVIFAVHFYLSGEVADRWKLLLVPVIAAVPWGILGPVLAWLYRARSQRALDRLLRSASRATLRL